MAKAIIKNRSHAFVRKVKYFVNDECFFRSESTSDASFGDANEMGWDYEEADVLSSC